MSTSWFGQQRRLQLKRPLLVRIWTEEGLLFVENDTLRIFGTGMSLEEAVRDFCLHVLEFYEHYKALPSNKAMGEALRYKALVRDLFIES